ncbi:MAG TPA: acyl-CoA dehydrogenase family protein, partial [Nevskiaceae bacterium]|nr:acyl-CoA dehydrogenase family protein [Nevskiaceae bacterium]
MDFTFDEQQLAFRDAAHRTLMVEAAPELLREIWETHSGRSAKLRKQWAEQGVTALSVPEAFDGLGQGDLEWVLIQQELGYFAIADSLIDSACLATDILTRLPQEVALRAEWLPKIASGAARIAVGHPVNPYVADAENAGLLLLWHDDEVHALPPADAKLTPATSIDRSRRLFKVEWQPTANTRVCDAGIGGKIWAGVLNRGALAMAAQQLGLAQRMLDLGVDYAAQRKQFGR